MKLTEKHVRNIFSNLATGKNEEFFSHVSDDVNWQVMGTHPLAGKYTSKSDFLNHTFKKLNQLLKNGVILQIQHIYLSNDTAIIEMQSLSTAINNKPFNNTYCWITRFSNNQIVEVRAYLDSELVKELFEENKI